MDSRGQTDRAGVRGDGKPRPLSGGAYDGTYREGAFCANVGGTAGLQSCPMKAQAFVEQGGMRNAAFSARWAAVP